MYDYKLDKDIVLYCVAAESFPDDVLKAHQSLHALVKFDTKRGYYGISRPENGKIKYKAAAEELTAGELSKHGLEKFMISKGNYACIDVNNFMSNVNGISDAFQTLIHLEDIDSNGYCIEWYVTDDVCRCMVKLK